MLESGTELLRNNTISSSTFTFTFNIANVPIITNGTTYTLECRAITQTDASVLLYSSYQTVTGKPFGKPTEIAYTIDADTETFTVLINNNGSHITGILICAPPDPDMPLTSASSLIVINTAENPIQNTSDPLVDLFIVTMNYNLVSKESQAAIIIATNESGMNYIENFSAVQRVT